MLMQTLFASTLCSYYNGLGKSKNGSTVVKGLDVVSKIEHTLKFMSLSLPTNLLNWRQTGRQHICYALAQVPSVPVAILTKQHRIRNYNVFKKSHETAYPLGVPRLAIVAGILLRSTRCSPYRSIFIDDSIGRYIVPTSGISAFL
jgi:hypothetical protein